MLGVGLKELFIVLVLAFLIVGPVRLRRNAKRLVERFTGAPSSDCPSQRGPRSGRSDRRS